MRHESGGMNFIQEYLLIFLAANTAEKMTPVIKASTIGIVDSFKQRAGSEKVTYGAHRL